MAGAYHTVNYRRFELSQKASNFTLEELIRKALAAVDGGGKTLLDRPEDRVCEIGDEEGRQIFLNRVADLTDGIFGELCLAQKHDLQALLRLEPSSVKLSNVTTATIFNLEERKAGTGTQFIRGMIYFLVIANHVFFIKLQAMHPASMKEFLDWLLTSQSPLIPEGVETVYQAEFDVSKTPGGVGDITSLRVSGTTNAQIVLPINVQDGAPRKIGTSRKVYDRLIQFTGALPLLDALLGQEQSRALVESLGEHEYLAVGASVKVRGERTEQSRKMLQKLSNELADRGDGKVEVIGKHGKIVDGDAILRTKMPFDLPHEGSSLLDFDNVADQLREVYLRFVKDGKIKSK